MNRNCVFLWVIGIIFISTLFGCKKEGPQGPPGNANVSSSTFSVPTWYYSSPYYYVDLNIPELTSDNINSAAVMVYFSTGNSNWIALPYTQYNSPQQNYIMGFITAVGIVEVTWFYDTSLFAGDDPNTFYGTTVQLKVVVIPPSAMAANPDLDITNYNQVEERFSLSN